MVAGGRTAAERGGGGGDTAGGTDVRAYPRGPGGWSSARLRRRIESLEPGQPWEVWSLATAAALRRAGAAGPIWLHLRELPGPAELRRLRRENLSQLKFVLPGEGLGQAWIDAGLPAESVIVAPPALAAVTGTADAAAESGGAGRAALRRGWGIEDPHFPVVALLSDTPAHADVGPAMLTINLTAEASGRELVLLVHPEQHGRRRAQLIQDALGVGHRLIQCPLTETPWRMLAGVDAGLLGHEPAPRSLAAAAAAGVPVVGPDRPWHRDHLDRHDCLAPTAEAKKLADRLQHQALGLPLRPRREAAEAHGPICV